jgi:hypothetical protein
VQGRGSWLEKIVLLLAQAAFPWDEAPHYLMRDRDRIDRIGPPKAAVRKDCRYRVRCEALDLPGMRSSSRATRSSSQALPYCSITSSSQ